MHAAHQTCLAHLLRRCRHLAEDHPRATGVTAVQTILQQALAVRDRARADAISPHGRADARGHLIARLAACLGRPSRVPDVQRFHRHLLREFDAIWSCLCDPTIEATNWADPRPHCGPLSNDSSIPTASSPLFAAPARRRSRQS